MNVWAFPPTVFPLLEKEFVRFLKEYPDSLIDEFYLPAAVDSWISGNLAKVSVRSASCKWMGVTYKDDKPAVIEALSKLVEDGHYPTPLFASTKHCLEISYGSIIELGGSPKAYPKLRIFVFEDYQRMID